MELYTIAAVAEKLAVSTYTIRLWERKKVIPRAMFRKGQLRLWHPDEVKIMKKALKKARKGKKKLLDWQSFHDEVWTALRDKRLELLGKKNEEK